MTAVVTSLSFPCTQPQARTMLPAVEQAKVPAESVARSVHWRKLATAVKYVPKPKTRSTVEKLFMPPTSADGDELPTESTPLKGHTNGEVSIYSVFGKGDQLLSMVRRDWCLQRLNWIVSVLVLLFMFVITPTIIALNDNWTFSAAFYYCIQAALGIGFGDLNITADGNKWLMIVELVVGSAFVAFIASIVLTDYLSVEESMSLDVGVMNKVAGDKVIRSEGEVTKPPKLVRRGSSLEASFLTVGQPDVTAWPWQSLIYGLISLAVIVATGVTFGLVSKKWDFVTSLMFIVSACQTSGLVEPGIQPLDGAWPSVFVAFLCVAGVPVWAYCIGKIATLLAHKEQAYRRLLFAGDRLRRADDALVNRLRIDDCTSPVTIDRAGFLELCLLQNGTVSEEVLASIRQEHQGLRKDLEKLRFAKESTQAAIPSEVDLSVVSLRLRFLQLVALGLVTADEWDTALAKELISSPRSSSPTMPGDPRSPPPGSAPV